MAEEKSAADQVFAPGRTAVICGSAMGIGLAAARMCAKAGMNVVMVDVSAKLAAAAEALKTQCKNDKIQALTVNVGDMAAMQKLADSIFEQYGEVAFLMNNAGIQVGGQVGEKFDEWMKVLNVNLYGVIHGTFAFVNKMKAQKKPSMIVNTGSKQGITCPPGNTVYNISKAGVKCLTEGLQHTLRNTPDCQCTAHLLVPGWVNTSIHENELRARHGADFKESMIRFNEAKPAKGAWMPDQCIEYMVKFLRQGAFYIICPDNECSVELDKVRIQWTADDMIKDRVPLSRWHPDYKEGFKKFAAENMGKSG